MIGSLTTAVGRNKKGEGRTISKPILLFTERVQATSVLRPVNHYGYIRAKKERKKKKEKKKKVHSIDFFQKISQMFLVKS